MASNPPNGDENQRRTSSVYSGVSATARLNLNGSGGSRPTSQYQYVPSYMSHVPSRSQTSGLAVNVAQSPASAQSAPVELPANEVSSPPTISRGLLLVLVAGVHDSTLSYIEMLVSRQAFSGIILVSRHDQDAAVKQLKMDCFALIGRLSKEMSVITHFQDHWSQGDVENTVQQITKTGESIQGVVCCLEGGEIATESADILSMDADQLQQAWTRSVTFVHGAARATTTQLLSRCKDNSARQVRAPQGPFFLVVTSQATSAASQIAKSACDTLLLKLEKATKHLGLTVAYAEAVLIPDPVQAEENTSKATSGPFLQPAEVFSTGQNGQQEADYASPESPTKLWAMWSDAAE